MNELLPAAADPVRPGRMPDHPRLARMRFLSRLLDNSILLPGGYRIGLDPIIGLIPAVGDFVAASLSLWIIYDAARLGLPKRVLARMGVNVLIEAAAGSVPVAGDVLDAVWKANARNMRLAEEAYRPEMKPRSWRSIGLTFLLILVSVYAVLFAAVWFAVTLILSLFR